MSRDIGIARTPRLGVRASCFSGWCRVADASVALGGVQVQFAEEIAGGGVEDADVQVLGHSGDGFGRCHADPCSVWATRV